jgi:hypothetical protein
VNREDRRARTARPCPCGSGKKWRNCHALIERRAVALAERQAAAAAAMLPEWWYLP